MKKIVNISLSGRGFNVDEDAYVALKNYLSVFKSKIAKELQWKEVMDDVERRISELFTEKLENGYKDVVNINMVNEVIMQLGLPDGSEYNFNTAEESYGEAGTTDSQEPNSYRQNRERAAKKVLYRNPDDTKIGGVCSGLALYIGVDTTLLRVIFLVLLILGSSGFWIYIIFWIVVPKAVTTLEKCQMYGLPVNAENLSKFAVKK